MKGEILNIEGKKIKEITLPTIFSSEIREDIIKKTFETEKTQQPYGPNPMSGRKHSASGIIRHLRHKWKGGYGSGRSRIPRKIMWRRGTQFYWVGSEVSSTRGGRRAHAPQIVHMTMKKKINKKEKNIAFNSGISGTANPNLIQSRYERLSNKEIKKVPFIVESKITELKSQKLIESVKKILGELFIVAQPEKSLRSGKGKRRNRKYKKSQGVLIITGKNEIIKTNAFETKMSDELTVSDLYPLGRIVIYTENAINDLENKN